MDEKAIPYLINAGYQLSSQFAYTEAAWYYERACEHFQRLPKAMAENLWKQRVDLLVSLANIYRGLDEKELEIQRREEAFSVVHAQVAMRKLAADTMTPDQKLVDLQAELLARVAWDYAYSDRFSEAMQKLHQYQDILSADVSYDVQTIIYDCLGFIYYRSCEWDKAESYFLQNFRRAQEKDDKVRIAFSASCLQDVYKRSKNYISLRKYAEIGIEASKKNGQMTHNSFMSADTLGWLDGNLEMCIKHLEIALVDAKKSSLLNADDCYSRLCRTYRLVDAKRAIAYANEAISFLGKKGRHNFHHFFAIKGQLYLELGELDEGRKCYDELEALGEHSSELSASLALFEGDAQRCLYEITSRERELSENPFDAALRLARYPKLHHIKGLAFLSQSAKTEISRKRAKEELSKIVALIHEGGALPEVGMAYGDCMMLAGALGDIKEAREYYNQAREILESCGAIWYVEKLTSLFSQFEPNVETLEIPPAPLYLPVYGGNEGWRKGGVIRFADGGVIRFASTERIVQPSISVHLFGGFEIQRKGILIPEEEWRKSRKVKGVLKYLLLNFGKPIARDVLLELFWWDMLPEQASLNLNATIYTIRRVLEPDRPRRTKSAYPLTEGDVLRFNADSDFWLDVAEFEKHLRQAKEFQTDSNVQEAVGEWQAVTEIYRGELLPEERYEDWCAVAREQFREQYLSTLLKLGEHYYQLEEFDVAQGYYKQALDIDSYKEIALRMLMRCLVKLERKNEALQWYRKVASKLTEEMQVEPDSRTTKLYEQIRNTL
jgi:DNA-binding SARP family transcriptional activator